MLIADTLSRGYLPHEKQDEIDLTHSVRSIYQHMAGTGRQIE